MYASKSHNPRHRGIPLELFEIISLKWVMMSQITPKRMLDNQILLKLYKIFNSIDIKPNSTYPLSEPSAQMCYQLSYPGLDCL